MAKIGVSIIVSIPHCPTDIVQASRTMWNTNDDRYSDFGLFLYLETTVYGDLSTFIDFVYFFFNVDWSLYRDVSTFSKIEQN